jgi:hypothetical protein
MPQRSIASLHRSYCLHTAAKGGGVGAFATKFDVYEKHTCKRVVYTYDNGGNITSKKEYAFTTSETLGTVTNTITYTYDSTWKDELPSYNGESISPDSIGNPTTYRGATTTWFGRQMQSYTKGDTSITYKYDSDGLRKKNCKRCSV